MKSKLARLIPPFFLISTGMAEVIASTTFDGRTATGNTASGLNWVVNGIADPGDMSAFRFDGVAQNLFNNTILGQNNFAPQLNVGNNTTVVTQSWTTSVSLTPLPGTVVTIEGVTFDYVPMNGAGSNQVQRRSDFTFSLLDPSGMVVETFDIENATAGSPLPFFITIEQTFPNPITLSLPGTYTLAIRGGDFLAEDETGNHTAIDNLTINGTSGGGSAGLAVTGIEYDATNATLSLTWNSIQGQNYAVNYSTDLSDWSSSLGDPVTAGEGESTTEVFDLSEFSLENETQLFFQVVVVE